MSEPTEAERVPATAPPRRSSGRLMGGIVLTLAGIGLLVVGIDALVDPGSVVAGSSRSGRMDSDAEAQIGGMLLCFFGVTVLCFGIGLLKKKSSEGSPFGTKPSDPGLK